MSSQPKLPPDPVGIELLLELLNASEGLVARGSPPPEASDAATPNAAEPGVLPSAVDEVHGAETAEVPADIADVEVPVEIADEPENRFAAHIVRGMSKSKTG
jgi:hypothetical protein